MIYRKGWALIGFSAICVPACHYIGSCVLTISPSHTLGPNISHVLFFPQVTTIGGGLQAPPSIVGARRRHLRLARGSADFVCLGAHCYHHALPRPHFRPLTLTTPLYTTTLHSHLLPAHTPAPHSHLYFGYKLPVPHVPLDLASVTTKNRDILQIHSTHSINTRTHPTPTRLAQVYTRTLVVPPSSPHPRAFVCGANMNTAQVGVSLVSLFDPLFKRSRLHCLDVCLT